MDDSMTIPQVEPLCNSWEETTMYIIEGHNADQCAFMEEAVEHCGCDPDQEELGPFENVYAYWVPDSDPDNLVFKECGPDHEGARPYTIRRVDV